MIAATSQVLAKTPNCTEIFIILVIGLMMDGKMSLSKVVGIGCISQLFDAMPFITFATSDSVIAVKLLNFDVLWHCSGENFSKPSKPSHIC